ncbi:MAG: PAQR family membrane homeostasis protein TrhA [Bacteriovoracaceae bacterium]
MEKRQAHFQYGKGEEIANSVIHGLGIILSIIGLTVLLVLSSYFATIMHSLSYLVYGLSLVLLYTSSTLYHSLPSEKAKRIFKICDHAAIYLLIAGTYTPFLVINLRGDLGDTLLLIIWSLAILGVIFKFFFTGRFKLISTLLYIGMGWLIVFAGKPLSAAIGESGMTWLLAGGLTYTLGAIFYLLKKIPYTHAIWHLFVLMGSICHFVAVVKAANFSF